MNKRKFILDTDMGPDCDDCGALSMLDLYHRRGDIQLLGVTHCTSDPCSADVIAAIHAHHGVSTPIGRTERQGFLVGHPDWERYTAQVSAHYRKNRPAAATEPATPLLRRLLHEHRDVTVLAIGPLNNLADLLASKADGISPLDGIALVRQSVREVIVMGGDFGDPLAAEFNIVCDVPAAKYVSESCPVPMVYCGFEAGVQVMTGGEALEACEADHPVRLAYYYYTGGGMLRNSWDLVTVYYALEPNDPLWQISDECAVRFTDRGNTAVREGSGARYIRYGDERALEEILNGLIVR